MAWPPTIPSAYYSFILFVLLLGFGSRSCYGFGLQFGFDVHHRYSDPVQGILGDEGLPVKGSVEYYVAMAHRDRIIRDRHLAASNDQSFPLTFSGGNDTYRILPFGHLHYANVLVGTPSLSFFVALDTGSDLFWLPCDCKEGGCLNSLPLSSGQVLLLNIYSPNNSPTSEIVSCNNSLCKHSQCPSASSNCPYKVEYLSYNTSSTGILVEDVLHLITDDDQLRAVDTPITFGCGQSQTGTFLEGGAPNGLFGLGMEDVSVPSTLARNGLASNSFSMCFGPDGLGRITFGNNGSSYQKETPFNVRQAHPTYNVSITQIAVGRNSSELGLSVIFDSGTSFTLLTDPAYTFISESFNSQVQNKRHSSDSYPFEYCYELSPTQNYDVPSVNLTMKGGDQYFVTSPTYVIDSEEGNAVYCLGLVKSKDISIIGQNFMTGYRIVFDRERMVLGWKESNCYDDKNSSTLPVSPSHSPAASPAVPVNSEASQANKRNGSNSSIPVASPSSHSPKLKSFTYALTLLLVSFFVIV
ncbi:aspartyl protease family protein 1-like isoform X2 [Corylus avellana]|uniref:aspartyl protease family protein 1-like isoform X2 n=1 Tax=Corylus avellana TaxID=13451 RepID=UPI00286A36D2|nr:aspartyl protease family protein 1-like isoform X2 [Corylus avellana]